MEARLAGSHQAASESFSKVLKSDLNTHLQPMLHAVELPASIAHLDPSLANMH